MLLDNRYRLGPQIGRGGMAIVHAATDIRLRRQVAVKLFHPGADEVTLARLQAEAQLLAGLSHPGLLRVFDVCLTGERPYLVLELVTGTTLRTLVNKGRLEPKLVARLGARLAGTLRYVHSRHIVHRDIKPSNVLLDRAGECYLADFGIARAFGAARLTRSGQCVGTAAYLAPEQVAGTETGPAADIYSLGLVLLECLTGRPEYTGTEVEAALARLTRSPEVPPWLPPALRQTLIDMTARDPAARPDAETCAQRLDASLAGSPVPAPPTDLSALSNLSPAPRSPEPPLSDLSAAAEGPSAAAESPSQSVHLPLGDLSGAAEKSPLQAIPSPSDLSPAGGPPSNTAVSTLTDRSAAHTDRTKPWDLPPTDLSPAVPDRPTRSPAWLRGFARGAVAAVLVAGVGLAILLPGGTTASTPPTQPAAPPAQPVDPAPAVDLVPSTAVGHLVAPAAERQPSADEAKKSRKKGRGNGEKPEHDESGEG